MTGLERQVGVAQALVWVMYAAASYEGLLQELSNSSDEQALVRAARIVAEEQAGVEVMLPDAMTVLDAISPSVEVPGSRRVSRRKRRCGGRRRW